MRTSFLQYGKQTICDDDITAVVNTLKSSHLTTGPKVLEFESALAKLTNSTYAITTSNGTTALHCAVYALNISSGDEVIVTTLSFVASANCIIFQSATPVFCDISPDTLNIDPDKIESLITPRTKAIICVDYAGQLCDYVKIRAIADKHSLKIIQDAAHSFGVTTNSLADITTFSFHPVKNITTGEGGAVVTNNEEYAKRAKLCRGHGIDQSTRIGHNYDQTDIGNNYRLTDIQCALGLSQLAKLNTFLQRRQEIVALYDQLLEPLTNITPLSREAAQAFHLYVIKLAPEHDRERIYNECHAKNIGVNVHYKPIHMHSYYNKFNASCPVAESIYPQLLSLPIFPAMTDSDVYDVVACLKELL